jgi:hypothetical protein
MPTAPPYREAAEGEALDLESVQQREDVAAEVVDLVRTGRYRGIPVPAVIVAQ